MDPEFPTSGDMPEEGGRGTSGGGGGGGGSGARLESRDPVRVRCLRGDGHVGVGGCQASKL